MTRAIRLWGFFTAVVVAAIPALIAGIVTIDIYKRGPIPEKSVEQQTLGPFDPLSSLGMAGDKQRVTMSFMVDGGKEYSNLSVWLFFLRNKGSTPILPAEIYENIAVTIRAPWAIVAIDNYGDEPAVKLTWTRKDERTFVAQPVLINPGDEISAVVFLTNTEYDRNKPRSAKDLPAPKVTARISNMRTFSQSVSRLENYRLPHGVVIYIDGWGVPFTLALAGCILSWYLVTLRASHFLRSTRNQALVLTVMAALLAFSVAEVFTFYIFGGYPLLETMGALGFNWGVQVANWLVLLAHVLVSLYLLHRARLAKKARSAVSG
jgi:hypothetical protein